jgi:hypothetical protein
MLEGDMRIVTSLLLALVAVLVWLSFVGMASPAFAQGGPLPVPSGPSALLPLGPPARITVHPRPHLYRRCTRWYVVQLSPAFLGRRARVPFPDKCG